MRQGQQNRRGRGRSSNNNNNNNRRGQSPLTRSFESTGPDVKIRGTPAHIGEKYMSLARDAAASGDPVLAENYLQHAEHYNRIIMAAREQVAQQGGGDTMNGGGRARPLQDGDPTEGGDEFGDDDGDDYADDTQAAFRSPEPQPRAVEGHPRQPERQFGRAPDYNRPPRDRQGGETRGPSNDRPRTDRPARAGGSEPPIDTPAPPARHEGPPRRRERYQPQQHEQPEFLRRPVRRPRREANGVESESEMRGDPATAGVDDDGQE